MDANRLAGIEYHGVAGSTIDCLQAIERILHYRVDISGALILTFPKGETSDHCIILTTVIGDQIAIKSGFGSGYGGQGSRGFSSALSLLNWHGVELEEIDVVQDLIERLDLSALTDSDLAWMEAARRIRPRRLWEYFSERDFAALDGNPWRWGNPIIPMALIDDRLAELARTFWIDPDVALLKGYRHLEVIVRDRIKMSLEEAAKLGPSKLYVRAFSGNEAQLTWADTSAGEREGRCLLFLGAAKAYRNVRAHRKINDHSNDLLAEFLLLNHLYRLEASAVAAEVQESG